MSPPSSLVRLLRAAGHDRADLTLREFRGEQIRWAVTAGLGPWLRRCTAGDPDAAASPLWPLVAGADLTARVIHGEQMNAVEEIVHACGRDVAPLTFLKGISVCEQYYPDPHLRVMGDVDILVGSADVSTVASRLQRLGYRPESSYSPEFYETHHHARPMFHPGRRVWVEIHRSLFPRTSRVGSDRVFSADHVRAELRPSLFRGQCVNRLSDELQLIYLATHWAFGLKRDRGVVGVLDVIRLLRQVQALRWDRVLDALGGSVASTDVFLMLTYLHRRRLAEIDPAILRDLRRRQRSFGAANLAALHAVIDRYVVEGRPFGRLMSERNFAIVWTALRSRERASRNLLALFWNLLPSRAWLARRLTSRASRSLAM